MAVELALIGHSPTAYRLPPTAYRKTGDESMREDVEFTSLPVAGRFSVATSILGRWAVG